jgi:hypothetical protein
MTAEPYGLDIADMAPLKAAEKTLMLLGTYGGMVFSSFTGVI